MLIDRDIVCFANDWSADPTSKHHIIRRFAASNDVLWVESAGMRRPNLGSRRDLGRLARKAGQLFRSARRELPRLHVYAPPAIPLPASSLARRANAALYRHTLGRQMRRIGIGPAPLLWVFAPHVAPLIRGLPRSGLIYHCVDRWSAFSDYDAQVMAECEAELCRESTLVLASARDLAERCRDHAEHVHYVPHGVDHAHFARALVDGPVPEDLRDIPEPRVGFFGLIHEWVDVELLGALADRLPFSIVLIGSSDRDLSALTARPNVHHLGRRPFAQLPDYCRGFRAALVPFRTSELTRSVNPIKLREYAAAGLPVISTPLPEVTSCADIAVCASTTDEWVAAVRAAVERSGDLDERRRQSERVRDSDWSRICERIAELLEPPPVAAAPSPRGYAAAVS